MLGALGGFVVAEQLADDAPLIQPTDRLVGAPVQAASGVGEPVTMVAEVVAPAVVRIDAEAGTGSGILFDSSGLLVTNAHVVGDAGRVPVQLADGLRTTGVVVGVDARADVAVVRLEGPGPFPVATFVDSHSVSVGQLAVAIGSPFGLEQTVTAGIISAGGRVIDTSPADDQDPSLVEMIQTDAPINPGNSGGALADAQGHVVGMNTSIRTDGSNTSIGVGFALPSETVLLVAERILSGEDIEPGYIGVSGGDPASGPPGARITDVIVGLPAHASGIEVGDLVVSVNADPVHSMAQLSAKVSLYRPGDAIIVGVVRGDDALKLLVEVAPFGA